MSYRCNNIRDDNVLCNKHGIRLTLHGYVYVCEMCEMEMEENTNRFDERKEWGRDEQ